MREIPPALLAHLAETATTTCMLLRVTLRSGLVYGLAALDQDIVYDDGDGELTYVATNGFDASTISADIAYSVDNAEGYALISNDVPGVTEAMVEAGELDDAEWIAYLVNYRDLTQGHMIVDAGDLGEVRTQHGLVWIPELLSYAMRLRQPVGHVWSRTCRATFGSDANSPTGCGFNAAALWASGEVTAVGAEPDRDFTGDLVASSEWPTDPYPGRIEWLTGNNVGRTYSLEAFDAGAVTINEPMPYPIEVGDTYRIRPDCGKRYVEDCLQIWDNAVNFKGEPLIPVGDASAIQVPGGQLPGAGGWIGEVPSG